MTEKKRDEICWKIVYGFLGDGRGSVKQFGFARQILSLFPELAKWKNFTLKHGAYSLNYYLTDLGKETLRREISLRNYNPKSIKEKEVILGKKSGDNIQIARKPKNIFEFCK